MGETVTTQFRERRGEELPQWTAPSDVDSRIHFLKEDRVPLVFKDCAVITVVILVSLGIYPLFLLCLKIFFLCLFSD